MCRSLVDEVSLRRKLMEFTPGLLKIGVSLSQDNDLMAEDTSSLLKPKGTRSLDSLLGTLECDWDMVQGFIQRRDEEDEWDDPSLVEKAIRFLRLTSQEVSEASARKWQKRKQKRELGNKAFEVRTAISNSTLQLLELVAKDRTKIEQSGCSLEIRNLYMDSLTNVLHRPVAPISEEPEKQTKSVMYEASKQCKPTCKMKLLIKKAQEQVAQDNNRLSKAVQVNTFSKVLLEKLDSYIALDSSHHSLQVVSSQETKNTASKYTQVNTLTSDFLKVYTSSKSES